MSREFVALCCFAIGLLGSAALRAQDSKDEGVFEPGVQHVCVPAADGEGWDCGTETAPPANYHEPAAGHESETAAEAPVETAAAADAQRSAAAGLSPEPPRFLADPTRDTPYAPVEESAQPAVVEAAPTKPAAPRPVVIQAVPVAPAPVPVPPPVIAQTAQRENSPSTSNAPLGTAADFAQLPATAFTLQLAYAAGTSTFPALVAALGLDPATCYALRVRGPDGNAWLLAHGAFADVAAARQAQSALPRAAGLSAQWPRRIGALQTELAAAGR